MDIEIENTVDHDVNDLDWQPDTVIETTIVRNANDLSWQADIGVEDFTWESKPQKFVKKNMYYLPKNKQHVHTHHFKNACLYDEDVDDGFEVQTWKARKEYRKWLRQIRRQKGWYYFRRPSRIEFVEYKNDDGTIATVKNIIEHIATNTHVISKIVDSIVITKKFPDIIAHPHMPIHPTGDPATDMIVRNKQGGKNKNSQLVAQPKVRGTKPDEDKFRPKFFTRKMGQLISAKRLLMSPPMTQEKLARVLNIDTPTIRNIERGNIVRFNSEDELVHKLAKMLGMTIKYEE